MCEWPLGYENSLLKVQFKIEFVVVNALTTSGYHCLSLCISGNKFPGIASHRNLLCIFYMTAIQNLFCAAVFFHRSVQNFN